MKKNLSRKLKSVIGCVLVTASMLVYSQEKKVSSDILQDLEAPSKNFIINGSFNEGIKGWTHNGKHRGKVVKEGRNKGNCYKISGSSKGTAYFYNSVKDKINLEKGKTYTLSAWFKAENLKKLYQGNALVITNAGWSGSVGLGPGAENTDGWVKKSLTFTPPKQSKKFAKNGYYSFMLFCPQGAEGTLWVDDIQIEEGAKATEYSDLWNFEIAKMIKKMKNTAVNIKATQEVLQETLPDSYKQNETYKKLSQKFTKIKEIGKKLKNYQQLSKEEMANIVKDVNTVSSEVTELENSL